MHVRVSLSTHGWAGASGGPQLWPMGPVGGWGGGQKQRKTMNLKEEGSGRGAQAAAPRCFKSWYLCAWLCNMHGCNALMGPWVHRASATATTTPCNARKGTREEGACTRGAAAPGPFRCGQLLPPPGSAAPHCATPRTMLQSA